MLDALRLDPERECARIAEFIADNLSNAGYSRAVLGISGGIDSAVVASLCARALGPENVHGMIMPYATSNPASKADARLLIDQLGLSSSVFDITPAVSAFVGQEPEMGAVRMGNIMARCRMIALYDRSEAFRGLVMGTSNRTETLLGYFTMHGDAAAALKPIAHLYKCQVRALAAHLEVPEAIITKAPSADLWDGQTDEGDLGYSYDLADQILYLLTEEHLGEEAVAARGFEPHIVQSVRQRMARTSFKRRPALELTPICSRERVLGGGNSVGE